MFKKAKLPNNIYQNNNYQKATYTGLSKVLYYLNHKLLDFRVDKINNKHILEVGGGARPHIDYMDTSQIKTYTILDDKIFKNEVKKLKKKYKKIKFNFIDHKKLKQSKIKIKYSRLISSHTFEHFRYFEDDFIKLINMIDSKAIISIAIPCDPGLVWRFLQYISFFKQKKYYGWNKLKEKDLDDARDHITPAQNIMKIINYYFAGNKKFFFPFLVPLIEFNIFLIIQIKVSNFKNSF